MPAAHHHHRRGQRQHPGHAVRRDHRRRTGTDPAERVSGSIRSTPDRSSRSPTACWWWCAPLPAARGGPPGAPRAGCRPERRAQEPSPRAGDHRRIGAAAAHPATRCPRCPHPARWPLPSSIGWSPRSSRRIRSISPGRARRWRSATCASQPFGNVKAVNGVDLDIAAHRLTCLIGPNDARREHAVRPSSPARRPDHGTIKLNGQRADRAPPGQDRPARGRPLVPVPPVRLFLRMSVVDDVRLAVPAQPGESACGALRAARWRQAERDTTGQAIPRYDQFVGLKDKANEPVTSLSYAEQKLLGVARSLATGADVLLLDEPPAGSTGRRSRASPTRPHLPEHAGKTVCVVEHNLHFLEEMLRRRLLLPGGRPGGCQRFAAGPDGRPSAAGGVLRCLTISPPPRPRTPQRSTALAAASRCAA